MPSRGFHGHRMEALWKSYGNPTEVSWKSIEVTWNAYNPTEVPWRPHGSPMEVARNTVPPRKSNGGPTAVPWKRHGSTVTSSMCQGGPMQASRKIHVNPIVPWKPHGRPDRPSMGVSWNSHGSIAVQWDAHWSPMRPHRNTIVQYGCPIRIPFNPSKYMGIL